jgi:N-methylhydantoinase B/oxoprolinase/acetone carboxylase alpha subunit
MTEVGGKVPGGFAGDATEVFQEGLRIPPLKIIEGGRDVEAVWNIIMANVRTPRISYGDLRSMIGSLYVGERRIHELVAKQGRARFAALGEAIKDYSERRMRAEIAEMPDGEYAFEDNVIENDGVTSEPARLKVRVHIDADQLTVDYTGSDPQRRGPVNCTYGVTASATYNALLHLTDHSIPSNHGCYRPVRIIAPHGTIVNVAYPGASVGGNSEIHPHLVMAIYGALSGALPDRVSAHDGGTSGPGRRRRRASGDR